MKLEFKVEVTLRMIVLNCKLNVCFHVVHLTICIILCSCLQYVINSFVCIKLYLVVSSIYIYIFVLCQINKRFNVDIWKFRSQYNNNNIILYEVNFLYFLLCIFLHYNIIILYIIPIKKTNYYDGHAIFDISYYIMI